MGWVLGVSERWLSCQHKGLLGCALGVLCVGSEETKGRCSLGQQGWGNRWPCCLGVGFSMRDLTAVPGWASASLGQARQMQAKI